MKMADGERERRVRTRLSIGEIDSVWIYTATSSMFRFFEGEWQCSKNVYYGKDRGWFGWSSEPAASCGHAFIEMPPAQQLADPEFAEIISRYHDTATGSAG
ncbi:hypothetical protein BKG68_06000 [Mycobacteroides saopaulense]|uniref:Uncharacterized protein n=2 Tax=Mycobacteriaceae TaxID=1762 RepID=A0ABX3BVR8_9MYCO|nr:hypothetical protein BKG68_06000 [Mycobacteroides saopaulense]OHU06532.1 hypothetical protein BKG73_20145 [Mycobacteroides saopaulense]